MQQHLLLFSFLWITGIVIFKKIYWFKEESMWVRGGPEGETLQADSLLSVEPKVGLDPMTHEITTWAKTKSQMFNRHHLHAPEFKVFKEHFVINLVIPRLLISYSQIVTIFVCFYNKHLLFWWFLYCGKMYWTSPFLIRKIKLFPF